MTLRWEKRVLRNWRRKESSLWLTRKQPKRQDYLVSTTDISVDENYAGKPSIFAKLLDTWLDHPKPLMKMVFSSSD